MFPYNTEIFHVQQATQLCLSYCIAMKITGTYYTPKKITKLIIPRCTNVK